jgi:hypothetical protein
VDAGTSEVSVSMKRPVIAAIAIGAAAVLVGGALAGVVAYRDATSGLSHPASVPISAAQIADYRGVVNGWPYPFAPGDAVPKSPPILNGTTPTPAEDRTFVSFFDQCSWVNAVLTGPAHSRSTALLSLKAWDLLPVSISSADNSDGGWKKSVLDPAESGNLKPLKTYFASCSPYRTYRTSPGAGMVVDKPLPTASSIQNGLPAPYKIATAGDGNVGQYPVEIPVDNGPGNYARGTVTLDATGHPASYLVAKGDVIDYVARRFGFSSFGYLNTINQVRRGGYPWSLYAGDTLNLSASTILKVGTSDGKVLNGPPPNPLPPQN